VGFGDTSQDETEKGAGKKRLQEHRTPGNLYLLEYRKKTDLSQKGGGKQRGSQWNLALTARVEVEHNWKHSKEKKREWGN